MIFPFPFCFCFAEYVAKSKGRATPDRQYNPPTDTTPGDGRGFCFYETQSAYVLYSAQGLLRGESKKMAISFRL